MRLRSLPFLKRRSDASVLRSFEESFLYPNASFYADVVLSYAKQHTRSGQNFEYLDKGDRPWNDPGPSPWGRKKGSATPDSVATAEQQKPILRAVVFDMSSSSHIDTTSVQNLVDLKRSLERYAADQVRGLPSHPLLLPIAYVRISPSRSSSTSPPFSPPSSSAPSSPAVSVPA